MTKPASVLAESENALSIIVQSFWGTLKSELVHHKRYQTRKDAIKDITEYIEVFYNRQRKQIRLDYLSPAAYALRFQKEKLAA